MREQIICFLQERKHQVESIDQKLATCHPDLYGELYRKRGEASLLADLYDEYSQCMVELDGAEELVEELGDLALEEVESLRAKAEEIWGRIIKNMAVKDGITSLVMEIKACVGGEDACIFTGELVRMYDKFFERQSWDASWIYLNPSSHGLRTAIVSVRGKDVHMKLKHEAGVHRIQRVPITESGGRKHTSTATVAILPEPKDVHLNIADEDLEFQVCRSTGPGGQSVNTTDSCVTVVHKPTGVRVTMQAKSQHQNKAEGLRVLKARLYDMEKRKLDKERSDERRKQVGTGSLAERVRTYNVPNNRMTDHRIGLIVRDLGSILNGRLEGVIEQLSCL